MSLDGVTQLLAFLSLAVALIGLLYDDFRP